MLRPEILLWSDILLRAEIRSLDILLTRLRTDILHAVGILIPDNSAIFNARALDPFIAARVAQIFAAPVIRFVVLLCVNFSILQTIAILVELGLLLIYVVVIG